MPYVPDPASNLVAEPGDGQVDLSWNAPGGFGGFPPCPDGSAEYVDCAGTCFNNLDCADGTYDGCVEGNNTWTYTMGPGPYNQSFPITLDTDKPVTRS